MKQIGLYMVLVSPRRNREMAKNAEILLALYKKNKLGPGTKNMIEEARKLNLQVFIKEI